MLQPGPFVPCRLLGVQGFGIILAVGLANDPIDQAVMMAEVDLRLGIEVIRGELQQGKAVNGHG